MNKKKKILFIIIAIIAVILTIGLTVLEASVSSIDGSNDWKKGMILAVGSENIPIYEEVFDPDNNFYCVKENQDLPIDIPVFLYLFAGHVKIDGDDARFYGSAEKENADLTETDENGNIYYYKYLGHVNNPVNNLLAAILTTNTDIHDINLHKLQDEYNVNGEWPEYIDPDELGKVQMSLHLLWHKWATATGAHQYGFRSSNTSDNEENRAIVKEWIAKAERLTPYFNFKATIKQGYPLFGSWQDLIRVEIDPPKEKTEDITIVKKWDDKEYKAQYRPDSIKLNLYANGKEIDTVEFKTADFNGNYNNEVIFTHEIDKNYTPYDVDGKVTIKLKIDEANNTWTCTWEGLKAKDSKTETEIQYSAKEAQETVEKLEPQYKCTFDGQGLLNILQTTNVTVKKVWEDSNNKYLKRPQSITMVLKGNGKPLKEITLTGGSTDSVWQTIEEVPVYDTQGNVNKFTIEEINVQSPYVPVVGAAVESTLGNGFVITITNRYTELPPPPTKVTVKKEWNDGSNKSGKRPTSITVTLTDANGNQVTKNASGETISPVTLNSSNNWTYTFNNLSRDINYNVKETVNSTDYISSIAKTGDATNGYTIQIKNTEAVTITVNKEWKDDYENERPSYIDVSVVASGVNMTKSARITAADGWTYTFPTKFPKYQENGQLVTFSVKEVNVPEGYEVEKITPTADGYSFTITNTGVKIPTRVTVEKVWNDAGFENIRPTSITVTLIDANGNPVTKNASGGTISPVTLNAENGWKYTFENLYRKQNGTEIQYNVKETINSANYVSTVTKTGNTQNGYKITVTNSFITPTDVMVRKVWNDDNNRDGIRTESITVTLTDANGNPVTTNVLGEIITPVTLNSANNWTYTFRNLKTDIEYKVKESTTTGYTSSVQKTGNEFVITNTHNPELIEVPVTKVWEDGNNKNNTRPQSVTIRLLANGSNTGKTLTLNANNQWKDSFKNLYKNENGRPITYTVEEVGTVSGYTLKEIKSNGATGFNVTNTKIANVTVEKVWNDDNNRDGVRLNSVEVVLYATNVQGIAEQKVTLNANNNWKHTFSNLIAYKDNTEINYNIKEITNLNGVYTSTNTVSGDAKNGYKVTVENKHEPEKVDIDVTKVWEDLDNLDDLRPDSITIKLLENGADTGKTLTLNESNSWKGTFKDLYKYKNQGQQCTYTVQEAQVPGYESPAIESIGTTTVNGRETHQLKVTNKYTPNYDGYVEITGRVWVDEPTGKGNNINGTYGDDKDTTIQGDEKVKVILKDANGNPIKSTYTDEKGELTRTDYALITSSSDGTYTIRVNYDNSKNVYKLYEDEATVRTKLETAYVEFEYDGVKYTTVASATTGANTSKVVENEAQRLEFDKNNTTITGQTDINNWDGTITAKTNGILSYEEKIESRNEVVKYCHGKGTEHTNPLGAWNEIVTKNEKCNKNSKTPHTHTYGVDVEVISNINLGLFKREEPDVAIFSDLTKVQVTMKGQQYTYLYGVRAKESNDVGLKVKFQNKDTYTYKRPVNPADIAYVNQVNTDAMSVLVTYEVKVANLSTTLPVTVHNIINSFDSEYTLNTEGWTITDANGFKQATSGDLNITVNPQTESEAIELTYTVSLEAIKNLLNEEATLNNAVEIGSYSTKYGQDTLYAEQKTGGRTDKPYAGYDYNSHPGNAGIFINNEGRLEATNLEDDTDIAPSFVLHEDKEEPKTLSGTIWDDQDANVNDEERLGNGYKDDSEKIVKNVKVELYDMDGNIVKLYNKETKQLDRDAVTYTDENGNYSLDGVVTGEYFMKFTYGNDTEKLGHEATTIDRGVTTINARNYKSTIITDKKVKEVMDKNYTDLDFDKKWHITHTDNYSVAVDNLKDRLDIQDLTNGNFDTPENMTAYTKPFETQVEFEATGQAQVDKEGNIENVTNELDKLDFGIIERPRENLKVEKTITNFKIILSNGQVLTEGNPSDPNANMEYTKLMGFKQGRGARHGIEKRLLVEVDSELIQGAHLQATYGVKITNNNEKDYDYEDGYEDMYAIITPGVADGYIAKSNTNARYYYYGDSTGLNPIISKLEFVDYLDANLVYKEDEEWKVVTVNDLISDEAINDLISEEVENELNNNEYKILKCAEIITLERGASISLDMETSKLLSNSEDIALNNHAEIVKIDHKTARTIQETDGGEQVVKEYTPGNHIPNQDSANEPDNSSVGIIITPPTGLLNNIITYVIIALSGLLIMFAVVIIIKKRQLSK